VKIYSHSSLLKMDNHSGNFIFLGISCSRTKIIFQLICRLIFPLDRIARNGILHVFLHGKGWIAKNRCCSYMKSPSSAAYVNYTRAYGYTVTDCMRDSVPRYKQNFSNLYYGFESYIFSPLITLTQTSILHHL
jgi:hypothetical protein